MMPSVYIPAPRRQPDKLGFDEVSNVGAFQDGGCKKGSYPSYIWC